MSSMRAEDLPLSDLEEPAGTILVGSQNKRAYIFVCQSEERMAIERKNAADHGVQDMREFVFVLDGEVFDLTYAELRGALKAAKK